MPNQRIKGNRAKNRNFMIIAVLKNESFRAAKESKERSEATIYP